MTEYATVAEVTQALQLILQMVLFCMAVSLLVVYRWIISFIFRFLDFIDDMREQRAKHNSHVRAYYRANFRQRNFNLKG